MHTFLLVSIFSFYCPCISANGAFSYMIIKRMYT